METNWNQLIERYLQNELSEEGRIAFEQELQVNPELREELEMHELIQSAAKRASQRVLVNQVGKSYLRNLRIKQVAIGVLVTAAVATGIIYALQNKKSPSNEPTKTLAVVEMEEASEEIVFPKDTFVENQPNQTGDKSSLIQSSDWHVVDKTNKRSTISVTSVKRKSEPSALKQESKNSSVTRRADSVPHKVDYSKQVSKENSFAQVIEKEPISIPVDKSASWVDQYDSVGRFNELYCGYALVMNDAKIGFVDRKGKLFIPLIYDQIVVTVNIQSSKNKNKRNKKKVLYIPKRSGSEVKYCDEDIHPIFKTESSDN
ncbi:WG repeat-containing protein [Fluviicola taffensis]|uniref:KWG Leptospira repeat protein n=1 Tax=Fluviicola taffensis (strain DSM 16823 / NCIMB 13979 / RW262) TaxID=755732 RepID=F2IKH0_FLUTR|nr:WG repeat-containing protein [Fluviicola taffensis]AEA45096.1 hypothetical protein Fluta_3122 [Fluviicola taffensis DSM 16823]